MLEGYKRRVDFNDRREDGEVRGKVIIQRQRCAEFLVSPLRSLSLSLSLSISIF